MSKKRVTFQTPTETSLWLSVFEYRAREWTTEESAAEADGAVLALRERTPVEPVESLTSDAAERLLMHALLIRAQTSGSVVRCTMLDGTIVEGKPTLDWRPYSIAKRWLSIELQGPTNESERIVKVEIL